MNSGRTVHPVFVYGVIDMKYDTVIFDLDGTLTNTLADLNDSVNHALRKNGLPERTIDETRRFVGNGVRRLIDLSVPEGTDEAVTERCFAEFKEHYKTNLMNKTRPYDGIPEMLKRISDAGLKMAVVSNKSHEAVVEIVRYYFGEYIRIAVGQMDGMEKKPHPDSVYYALDKLGSLKENAIYVGDSEVDCLTAQNAGLPIIGVVWGFRGRALLEEKDADYIIDTPKEIFDILGI